MVTAVPSTHNLNVLTFCDGVVLRFLGHLGHSWRVPVRMMLSLNDIVLLRGTFDAKTLLVGLCPNVLLIFLSIY